MNTLSSNAQVSSSDEPTLPVLSPGLPYLLSALGDEEIDLEALATAVRCFPSITGRLVALANSAWVSPKRPIISLPDACSLLGLRMVRCVSFALAVARPFDPGSCPGFDVERYWCSALLTAEGAALLSEYLDDECDVDTAHTAGLLHNLGLMWLADSWPQETALAFRIATSDDNCGLAQALYAATGNDYCEAGGRLSEAWQLPEALTIAIRYHRTPTYRGPDWQFAAVCGNAAGMSSRLWRGQDWVQEDVECDALGLSPTVMQSVFQKLVSKRDAILHLSKTLFS
jgi:HD-like signal output (HDOD) protein